ncbi:MULTISPECIES: alpha-ketoacid dehydrogenase subunit beta [Bacillales]|jgi:pyruvate dehydrogenase E1 component beta subunit|uniref:Pyruvate/2-oxoglutarate/acetoin dehydrogenase complex, dehydrogenase (E1) component, beta subunit n=1 Tax=Brevibacillus aydinogluensis TaxID=927786 RepID=A0AA48RHG1_9BACL|nr:MULTISPECIES: alpha-ketoacid dehydrogenase subunit beta [Bacillales]REK65818.1 MAG: alpha-ketoacid dehydrogenase subunit beta [Brevibacillus sp.]MBR8659654.1 alpha-ketoacid dehydrogenase subunit beta [Brevibacillus sp. NL20B1]MDT3415688.1 pyruvate dehydrogenase E1 component beta subunit [Brevibacillus aydinogluensis]NNV03761.1 alpha-ketoacid dehydrogenase subunit beta [Brevibacillus sp. MCWH]UFJ60714.1 alpha-ketoacid dehydrogenase subunit beta [Anoxybacillus sediminis]
MAQMTMIQAITDALRCELKRDETVLVFGEDVGKNGGVFRATEGLQAEFGEHRVFDTPLAESGIGGLAVGLSVNGFRPVAEIQFFGFVFETFDAIASQASRMRYRSGGRFHSPITFRSPFGGGVKTPELHADSLEGLILQTPGVKVVIPSNPYDAKGLLISAIRDNDPVVFLEHMKLYRSFRQEVPEGEYTIPLGKANVVKEGSDVTIITYGAMVHTSLKAAEEIEKARGAKVEVIDLRTINPIDIDTIVESVKKTNRAIVVQEAQKTSGVAAEIIAQINERAILHLEAPVLRVAAPDTVYPFAQAEDIWLPDVKRVVDGLTQVLDF